MSSQSFHLFLVALILLALSHSSARQDSKQLDLLSSYISSGEKDILNANYNGCVNYLVNALQIDETHIDAHQMIGTAYFKLNDFEKSIYHFKRSLDLSNWKQPIVIANYLEALRASGDVDSASGIGRKCIEIYPNETTILFNLAVIEDQRNDFNMSSQLYQRTIQLSPDNLFAWKNLAEIYLQVTRDFIQAETILSSAIQRFPTNSYFYHLLGTAYQFRSLFNEAIQSFHQAIDLRPERRYFYDSVHHLAACYQMLGQAEQAWYWYNQAIPFQPNDAGIRNNYGALLGTMGRKEEEVYWLKEALTIEPNMSHALVNLGGYYQDEGLMVEAKDYLLRAAATAVVSSTSASQQQTYKSFQSSALRLRVALLMPPVASSWFVMWENRRQMEEKLLQIIAEISHSLHLWPPDEIDSTLDRIHFYIVYHGLNDRYMQELIMFVYRRLLKGLEFIHPKFISTTSTSTGLSAINTTNIISTSHAYNDFSSRSLPLSSLDKLYKEIRPNNYTATLTQRQYGHVSTSTSSDSKGSLTSDIDNNSNNNNSNITNSSSITPSRKVKIGFLSKFLGIFEPHGLLLDGVMKFLPRHQFEVYALPIARTDYKPLSPSVREAVDVVVEISLSREHALKRLASLYLDILIFADTMSEPMTHFMAHSRLAVLQMAFWGNPITSASAHIDYFLSADCLEHPYRTRIPLQDEPYSEQVILLPGQGIWYSPPEPISQTLQKANFSMVLEPDRNYTRQDFDLKDEWFLYFVPQSVFKIHPFFDQVLAEIIRLQPRGHLVVTGGRKQRWTDVYITRLLKTFAKHNITSRLHMIERVSSEKFLGLLKIADVMLHPFPFDGSRTSADSLIAGLVYVTLPTEYLRGRMGTAFYRTMNLPQLVAHNMSGYVQIAVHLGNDVTFYHEMSRLIQERVHLIWEDIETVYGWIEFLSVVSGLKKPTWEWFLLQNQHHFQKPTEEENDGQQLLEPSTINENKSSSNQVLTSSSSDSKLSTIRFLQRETAKRDERAYNWQLFDETYGPEVWLLEYEYEGELHQHLSGVETDADALNKIGNGHSKSAKRRIGVARLETHLTRNQVPRIFTNWKRPMPKIISRNESSNDDKANNNNGRISESVSRRIETMIYSVSSSVVTGDDNDEGIFGHQYYLPSGYNHTNIQSRVKEIGPSTQLGESKLNVKSKDQVTAAAGRNMASTTTTNTAIKAAFMTEAVLIQEDILLDSMLLQTRELVMQGKFDQASQFMQEFATTFSTFSQTSIKYLIDFGSLQIFRGEYRAAFNACQRAVELADEDAPLAYSCVGVSAMYLGRKAECLHASYMAYKLLTTSSTNSNTTASSPSSSKTNKNSNGTTSTTAISTVVVNNKYPSMIFSVTLQAIEFNLISAYKVFQMYTECVATALSLMSLPSVEQGGGYILMFAMVNWTMPRLIDLQHFEAKLRSENKLFFPSQPSPSPPSASTATINLSSTTTTMTSIFVNEIRRIQSRYAHILNPTVDSLTEMLPVAVKDKLLQDLISIVSLSEPRNPAALSNNKGDVGRNGDSSLSRAATTDIILSSEPTITTTTITTTTLHPRHSAEVRRIQELSHLATIAKGGDKTFSREEYIHSGIVLLGQYYIPQDQNPMVIRDINQALINNLKNPLISEIILLNEIEYDFSSPSPQLLGTSKQISTTTGVNAQQQPNSGSNSGNTSDKITLGVTGATNSTSTGIKIGGGVYFPNVWKIKQFVIGRRILFQDAFHYANQNLVGRTVILANADIYFDDTLSYVVADAGGVSVDLHNQVLALLKWSDRGDSLSLHLRTDSQDAWIFQPPLHTNVLELSNFHMGIARCDNRLVEIFESSGHRVINPAFAIHAIELHSTKREGVIYSTKGAAQGETKDVFLSDQHIF